MSRCIHFELPWKPVPLKRARIARGAGRMYDPSSNVSAKDDIATIASLFWKQEPSRSAVAMSLFFYMGRPDSHLKKNGERRKAAPELHTYKPDLDNLAKLVKDALTGVIYHDDSQVIELKAFKYWGDKPKTVVYLKVYKD